MSDKSFMVIYHGMSLIVLYVNYLACYVSMSLIVLYICKLFTTS